MSDSSADRNPVEMLAEEFLARIREGEHPSLTEYTSRHPELADEIREVFPALVLMEDVRPVSGDLTGSYRGGITAEGKKLERLGDFRVLREVGRGGMGIVYEAEQESLGRHVALKVLPSHTLLDRQRIGRFQREARAAARLHHTNIVPVFGVGEHDGLHYYVMQFIQGLGLDEVQAELIALRKEKSAAIAGGHRPNGRAKDLSAVEIAQSMLTGQFAHQEQEGRDSNGSPPTSDSSQSAIRKPQSAIVSLPGQSTDSVHTESGREFWQSVARIGYQVADALSYAHAQGTLHRDIKPSNLLLDTRGTVWVTDFGLAKAADSDDLTHTGDIVGTLRYMAPERFQGESDARSDLYALGLTLYEMLTLQPAFKESDRNKLIDVVLHQEPPPPRKINPHVPRDLETIVLKAIAKEPALRYQSAADLAEDLHRFVEDKPIRARRVSARERFVRWCRRNPALAGVTAALLAVLILGNAVVTWKWLDADFAKAQEAEARQQALADSIRAQKSAAEATEAADDAKQAAVRERDAAKLEQAARLKAEGLIGEQYVAHGTEALARQDVSGALVWYAAALEHDQADAERAQMHRTRLAALLRGVHRPEHVLSHAAPIRRVDTSDNGRLATAGLDKTVQVWDLDTGERVGPPLEHVQSVSSVYFLADGKSLVTFSRPVDSTTEAIGSVLPAPGEIRLWNLETREFVSTPYERTIGAPAGNSQQKLVLLQTVESTRQVFDIRTGKPAGPPLAFPQTSQMAYAVSPSGEQAATISRDLEDREFTLQIWNTLTGDVEKMDLPQIPQILASDGADVRSVFFARSLNTTPVLSFVATERLVVRGPTLGFQLFGTPSKRALAAVEAGEGPEWHAASADGRLVAYRSAPRMNRVSRTAEDARVRVFETATGNPVGTSFTVKFVSTRPPVFSPDGGRLLLADGDQSARIWDVASGKASAAEFETDGPVTAFSFSPDGRYVQVTSGDNAVRVWDSVNFEPATPPLKHDRNVTSAVFTPDGSRLVTVAGNSARVWPLAPPALRQVTISPGDDPTERVSKVLLGPNGSPVLTIGGGPARGPAERISTARVRLWNATTGREIGTGTTVTGPSFFSLGSMFQFSPDGELVMIRTSNVLGSPVEEGGLRASSEYQIWNTRTGQTVNVAYDDASPFVRSLRFSADGRLLVGLRLPGPPSRAPSRPEGEDTLPESAPPRPVVFYLFDAQTGKQINKLDLADYALPGSTPAALVAALRGAVNPDASHLARIVAGEMGPVVRVLDTHSGRDAFPALTFPLGVAPSNARFSADGRRLLTLAGEASGGMHEARVWDAASGKPLGSWLGLAVPTRPARSSLENAIRGESYSWADLNADGSRLLTILSAGQGLDEIQVWNVDSGEAAAPRIVHEGNIATAEFSPDGRRLLTVSAAGEMRIWDVATSEQLSPVLQHEGTNVSAEFSSDGRRVISRRNLASTQGVGSRAPLGGVSEVRVWDAITGQPLSPPIVCRLADERTGGFAGPGGFGISPADADRPYSAAGDRLVSLERGRVIVTDLSAETRPVKELVLLSQPFGGRRINSAGRMQSLEAGQFEQRWHAARERYAADWQDSAPRGLDWHREQLAQVGANTGLALASVAGGQLRPASASLGSTDATASFSAVLWHADRLIAAGSADFNHYYLRGRLHQALSHWEQAVADFSRAQELDPDGAFPPALFSQRAKNLAELGKWEEAAQDLLAYEQAARQFDFGPLRSAPASVTLQANMRLALVRLQQGDLPAYRELCGRLLKGDQDSSLSGFGSPSGSRTRPASWPTPWSFAYIVSPRAFDDYAPLAQLLEDRPGDARSGPFAVTRAAAIYRVGNYAEAEELLRRSVEARDTAAPLDYFFLAMAQHQQGKPEAKTSLALGQELLRAQERERQERLASPIPLANSDSTWEDRLAADHVRREAEQLLADKE